jgi:hypothetical protein
LARVSKVVRWLVAACLLAACEGAEHKDRAWERIQAEDDAILGDFRQVKNACNAAFSRNDASFERLVTKCRENAAQGLPEAQRPWCRDEGDRLLVESKRISDICMHATDDLERSLHHNAGAAARESDRERADRTARRAVHALRAGQRAAGESMGSSETITCMSQNGSTAFTNCR